MDMKYSVLMSVYYKENPAFLSAAIDSMFNQTVPCNDFVLVCDGPLSQELDKVIEDKQQSHPELHVIRLKKNRGLGNSLNIGIKECKNEIIARMDSDDISFMNRCERQLDVFMKNPEISICSGTVVEFVDSINNITGKRELPETNDQIISFSRKRNPFNHPAVMFRKSCVDLVNGYSEKYHLFEDYYLWIRMLMNGAKARNIKDPILYMRMNQDSISRRGGWQYAKNLLAFHRWMKTNGWISEWTYISGALPHAVVCILPNTFRKYFYKLLRTK